MPVTLSPDRIKEADYARHVFRVSVPNDVTITDVLKPDFWVHTAGKMHNTDIIEVMPEDESWFAQLIVRSASRLHARCVVLNYKAFDEVKTKDVDGPFIVKHNGPKAKWAIIRRADKALVKDGFESRELAGEWLDENQADLLA